MSGNLYVDKCQAICKGYNFYGVQPSFCFRYVQLTFAHAPSNFCDTPCYGNSNQNCGGISGKKVYTTQSACSDIDQYRRIKNPGFELGKGYWNAVAVGQMTWATRTDALLSYQGQRFARIADRRSGASLVLSQSINLCPDLEYDLSWFGQSGLASSCTMTAQIGTTSLGAYSEGFGWTVHSIRHTAQEISSELLLTAQCGGLGSNGYRMRYIDNVFISRHINTIGEVYQLFERI